MDITNPLVYVGLGVLGWLSKMAFSRNGCIKRIEQKLDDLIKEFDEFRRKK